MGEHSVTIPARKGVVARVSADGSVKVVNTPGTQVVDPPYVFVSGTAGFDAETGSFLALKG